MNRRWPAIALATALLPLTTGDALAAKRTRAPATAPGKVPPPQPKPTAPPQVRAKAPPPAARIAPRGTPPMSEADRKKAIVAERQQQQQAQPLGRKTDLTTKLPRRVDDPTALRLRSVPADPPKVVKTPSADVPATRKPLDLQPRVALNLLNRGQQQTPPPLKTVPAGPPPTGRNVLTDRARDFNESLGRRLNQVPPGRLVRTQPADGLIDPPGSSGLGTTPDRLAEPALADPFRLVNLPAGGRVARVEASKEVWTPQLLPGFTTLGDLTAGGRRSDPRTAADEGESDSGDAGTGKGRGGVKSVEVTYDEDGNAVVTTTYNDSTVIVQREVPAQGSDTPGVETTILTKDGTITVTKSTTDSGATNTKIQVRKKDGTSYGYQFLILPEGFGVGQSWWGDSPKEGEKNGSLRSGSVSDGYFYYDGDDKKKHPSPLSDDLRALGPPPFDREQTLDRLRHRSDDAGPVDRGRGLSRELVDARKAKPNPDGTPREVGPLGPPVNPVADPPDELPQGDGPLPKPDKRLGPPWGGR